MECIKDRSTLSASWKPRNRSDFESGGRKTGLRSPVLSPIQEDEEVDSEDEIQEDNSFGTQGANQRSKFSSPPAFHFRQKKSEGSHKACPPLLKPLTPFQGVMQQTIRSKIKQRNSASTATVPVSQGSPVIGPPPNSTHNKGTLEEKSGLVWVGGPAFPQRSPNSNEFQRPDDDIHTKDSKGTYRLVKASSISRSVDPEIANFLKSSPLTSTDEVEEIPNVMKTLPPIPQCSRKSLAANTNEKRKRKKKKRSYDSILSVLDNLGGNETCEASIVKDSMTKEMRVTNMEANGIKESRQADLGLDVRSPLMVKKDVLDDNIKTKTHGERKTLTRTMISSNVEKFNTSLGGLSSTTSLKKPKPHVEPQLTLVNTNILNETSEASNSPSSLKATGLPSHGKQEITPLAKRSKVPPFMKVPLQKRLLLQPIGVSTHKEKPSQEEKEVHTVRDNPTKIRKHQQNFPTGKVTSEPSPVEKRLSDIDLGGLSSLTSLTEPEPDIEHRSTLQTREISTETSKASDRPTALKVTHFNLLSNEDTAPLAKRSKLPPLTNVSCQKRQLLQPIVTSKYKDETSEGEELRTILTEDLKKSPQSKKENCSDEPFYTESESRASKSPTSHLPDCCSTGHRDTSYTNVEDITLEKKECRNDVNYGEEMKRPIATDGTKPTQLLSSEKANIIVEGNVDVTNPESSHIPKIQLHLTKEVFNAPNEIFNNAVVPVCSSPEKEREQSFFADSSKSQNVPYAPVDATGKNTTDVGDRSASPLNINSCTEKSPRRQYLQLGDLSQKDLSAWWNEFSGGRKLDIQRNSIESWIKQTNECLGILDFSVASSENAVIESNELNGNENNLSCDVNAGASEPLENDGVSKREIDMNILSINKTEQKDTNHNTASEIDATAMEIHANNVTQVSSTCPAADQKVLPKSDCQRPEHRRGGISSLEVEGNVYSFEKDEKLSKEYDNTSFVGAPTMQGRATSKGNPTSSVVSSIESCTSPQILSSNLCLHQPKRQSGGCPISDNRSSDVSGAEDDGNAHQEKKQDRLSRKPEKTINVHDTALKSQTEDASEKISSGSSLLKGKLTSSSRLAFRGFPILPNKPKLPQLKQVIDTRQHLNKLADGKHVGPIDYFREDGRTSRCVYDQQTSLKPPTYLECYGTNISSYMGRNREAEIDHLEALERHLRDIPHKERTFLLPEEYQLKMKNLQMQLKSKGQLCEKVQETSRAAMERNDRLVTGFTQILADNKKQRKFLTSQIQRFGKRNQELRNANEEQGKILQSLRDEKFKMETSLVKLRAQLVKSKAEITRKCEEADYWKEKYHEVITAGCFRQ